MKTSEKKQYWSIESYREAVEIFDAVSTIILLSLAEHPKEIRNIVIRNFIARGTVSLKGVLSLWEIGDYQDCWVLYRGILDRLFHLFYLTEKDEFLVFEKWSFEKQYESRNKIKSNKDFKDRLDLDFFSHTEAEKTRYKAIKQEKLSWRRPQAKEVSRDMNLEFLYDHGYDYASTLVHPMANDGQEDFLRQTGLGEEEFADQRVVVNNSILAATLLVRQGLNSSNLTWRAILHDFLDDIMSFLNTGSEKYKLTFAKIASLDPNTDWCKAI